MSARLDQYFNVYYPWVSQGKKLVLHNHNSFTAWTHFTNKMMHKKTIAMQRASCPVQKIIHTNRWLLEGLPSGQLSDLRSLEVKP